MKLDLDSLKKKLHTLDKAALLRLRDMLTDSKKLKKIKEPTERLRKTVSQMMDKCTQIIKTRGDIQDETKEELEGEDMIIELKFLDTIDKRVESNINEILKEIDKILSELPPDTRKN